MGGISREGKGGEARGLFHDLTSWFLMLCGGR